MNFKIIFIKLFIFFVVSSQLLFSQELLPINLKYSSYAVTENGKILGYFGEQNRVEILNKNQISGYVFDALISTEDRDFYGHNGVSIKGLIRAAWKTVTGSKQGGSTITMQLARNLFLSSEQTLSRKWNEINIALDLEKKFTKDQILLLYLNTVYFGHGAYGIWVAAQEFFSKPPDKLNILESATLIGLLKSPSGYDPTRYPDKTLKRRNVVLHNLVDYGKITEYQFATLKNQPLGLNLRESIGKHFLEHVRKEVSNSLQKYGKSLNSSELKITTSLDFNLQKAAEKAIETQWKQFPAEMKNSQVGLVTIENGTGKIRALIGGNPKSDPGGLNRALQIHRQPGSAFKPFLYSSLLEKGYSLATPLNDFPIIVDSGKTNEWRPQNDDETFSGKPIPMKYACQHSINLAAADAITRLTCPDSLIVFVKKFGVESFIPPYPSIALGTAELSPVEMAVAVSVFASGGYYSKTKSILKIEDKYNNIYYVNQPDTLKIIEPETCYLITEALKAVVDSGTATSIRKYYKGEVAGKTGTTQNSTDAWFVGYTPVYSTAVWVGFDDPKFKLTGSYRYGGQVAAPVFGITMQEISKKVFGLGNVQFSRPATVIDVELCEDSGLLATDKCPHKKLYPVNSLKMPNICDKHN